uniref:DNA sequence from clone AEHM-21P16 n=1 Tax=Heliconius melpomene TaxID=34740 RepID=C3PPH5_HELME|nr:unnamed protein product [Heliconius melpomene]
MVISLYPFSFLYVIEL